MTNVQLYLAIGVPILAILASMTVSLVQISGIRWIRCRRGLLWRTGAFPIPGMLFENWFATLAAKAEPNLPFPNRLQ